MDERDDNPNVALGRHLKALRVRAKETLAEASGAVEIDVMELDSIEKGYKKPPEDILLLLISHFQTKEKEALHLWDLAGYDEDMGTTKDSIKFTNTVIVKVTKNGVTLDLGQASGKDLIARFGMSHEHAKRLARAILDALEQSQK